MVNTGKWVFNAWTIVGLVHGCFMVGHRWTVGWWSAIQINSGIPAYFLHGSFHYDKTRCSQVINHYSWPLLRFIFDNVQPLVGYQPFLIIAINHYHCSLITKYGWLGTTCHEPLINQHLIINHQPMDQPSTKHEPPASANHLAITNQPFTNH